MDPWNINTMTKEIKKFINKFPEAHIEITSQEQVIVVKMSTHIKTRDGEDCPFTFTTGFHNDQKPTC